MNLLNIVKEKFYTISSNNKVELNIYKKGIELVELNEFKQAIIKFNEFIELTLDLDDKALAYLNCAFLEHKLRNYNEAIDYFSKAIQLENDLITLRGRSKGLSFNGRSESKFKVIDYKGAIEDKNKAYNIDSSDLRKNNLRKVKLIDYNNLSRLNKLEIIFNSKIQSLFKISLSYKNKYDLIDDYKKRINKNKIHIISKKLIKLSHEKYQIEDYKGSIIALRRAEKYF
tara:strand:+ start:29378 stop:30061 length:684 start_codon:yes stop_codon:yes gene_type:complete